MPSHDPVGDRARADSYLDDDQEWVSQAPKGFRIAPATGVLLLALFAVCGLWGGSVWQKHRDRSRVSATAASTFGGGAGRRAAAAAGGPTAGPGASATGGLGGAAGGGASGIVTDITGSTVSLTDASGNLVKITLSPSSVISKSATATAADLQLGQTVVVRGAKAADGSMSASSVIIAPSGANAGGGADTGATGGG